MKAYEIQIHKPGNVVHDLDSALDRAERERRDRLSVRASTPEARREVLSVMTRWAGEPVVFEGSAIFSVVCDRRHSVCVEVL